MTDVAERPPDETERLEAIRRYDILDTPPDGAFDRITAVAARYCNVPIATITIVDEDRIWFKSTHGVDVDEVGRDPGLCASAILQDSPYIVTDAIHDPRTLHNPLVRGELGLRFYVGVPLVTKDGYMLGTLNIIDAEPREPTEDELATLEDLAEVVIDELELRLAARRTIELEAAREAAEFRESLLAGISHEMRTEVSILNGIASLDPADEVDASTLHTMMRRHIQQLDWLVNQYLDFTTLEAGRTPTVNPDQLDLEDLVRDVAEVFANETDIDVEVTPDAERAIADPDRTRQVLFELVNNAIRFSPGEPEIRVTTERRGDDQVAITVADRGLGIHPDDHERVFDKLYRGRDSTGSGIGLFVARALMRLQDGSIELESDLGEGSRFTLVLSTVQS